MPKDYIPLGFTYQVSWTPKTEKGHPDAY